jgi:hypothetical protein
MTGYFPIGALPIGALPITAEDLGLIEPVAPTPDDIYAMFPTILPSLRPGADGTGKPRRRIAIWSPRSWRRSQR